MRSAAQQFGINVKVLRIKAGLTQEGLAYAANVDRSYVGAIERGERNVSIVIVLKLARGLRCAVADLFEGIRLGKQEAGD